MDRDRKKDMKKKITVLTLGAVLFALCSSAEAQQSKESKIGWLGLGPASSVAGTRSSAKLSVSSVTLRART